MPLVEVRLLGPLEVVVDGRPIDLRRKKQRALLALLALRAGEVVSTDRLVDDLWGEAPPKAAVGSLQNVVSELRKLLGPELLLTRAPGYALELDRQLVDVHRFEAAVREGTGLRDALALWRGPALADLSFEPFAPAAIARLEELRTVAREELFDADLQAGRHAQLVPELEAFVAEHPLREHPRGQLMLALYRSGRQADALEAYRQARGTLVQELGIDPSSELQQLEQAILRHDPAVAFEEAPAAPHEPDRRRTVTVLFADVVESTELAAEVDPEIVRRVMRGYFEAVRAAVAEHGGVVEKFIGDAAMAVFGIPEQHEDDALRAVRAALALRASIGRLRDDLAHEHGIAFELRIGVNTGEVLVSDVAEGEPFVTGHAVNLAMRLEQAAAAGEILVGASTHQLVRHVVEATPVDPLHVGGALDAFRLEALGETSRRLGTAPLVGRADELAWLRAAVAGVQAERRSRVVTVLGEAGVGKTRLVSELTAELGGAASALVGRCVSYGEGATFLPLAEIVRQAAAGRNEIAALLPGDEEAPLIAEHVARVVGGADAVASTGEVFWAVRRFLEALARRRPVVMVLEDVHWAEPTLLDLIEYLAAWTADAPLLVVCLARPELLDRRPGWGPPEKTLRLEALDAREARLLVGELAVDELDAAARLRVVEVAEGNPLFLEQLLIFSAEAGLRALAAVPPTVEALLGGRIATLEPDERALLERAAVAGRSFTRGAIVQLTPPHELAGVDRCLGAVVRRGLVEPAAEEFRFHHALIRDVAYAGITKEARAELHERYGTWLETREGGVEEIAGYHLEQAYGYHSELRPKDPQLPALAQRAGERLAAAGVRAWKGADASAAGNLLGRAAPLLQDRSQRAEVLCELGIVGRATDLEGAAAPLAEGLELARDADDVRLELRLEIELLHLALFLDREASPEELVQLIRRAIPIFEELGDERALGRAWRALGYVRGSMEGRCAEWLEAAERSASYYRRSGWSPGGCFIEAGMALFHGPTPVPDAVARCEDLLEASTDRLGTANVLVYLAGLHALAERYDDTFAMLADADRMLEELNEPYLRADHGGRVRGRAHLLAGELDGAERTFRESCAALQRFGDEAGLSALAADLAQVLYLQGRLDEAERWSLVAREHSPGGDRVSQVTWRAITAKVKAGRGLLTEGEQLGREALGISESTDALTHRGDVHLDLASVLCAADRGGEAAGHIEKALRLFELKGNLASTRIAEARLAEVALV